MNSNLNKPILSMFLLSADTIGRLMKKTQLSVRFSSTIVNMSTITMGCGDWSCKGSCTGSCVGGND